MTPPRKPPPPSSNDESLLDPEAFWEPEQPAEPVRRAPSPTGKRKQDDGDVAEVTSTPTSAPSELYLPREISKKAGPAGKASGSRTAPRPIHSARREPPVPRGKRVGRVGPWIAVGLILGLGLAAFLIWKAIGSRSGQPQRLETLSGVTRPGPQNDPSATDKPGAQENNVQPESRALRPNKHKLGTLRLTSDPPGALVFIDDQRSGSTPTTIKDIEAGSSLNIRLEAQGFRPWTQTVVFDGKDLDREFHAGLLKKDTCVAGSGWVYVNSKPSGATVELNGKRLPGKTPMVIDSVCANQQYRIRVQARGFRTWWHSFRLTPGQVVNLAADLKK